MLSTSDPLVDGGAGSLPAIAVEHVSASYRVLRETGSLWNDVVTRFGRRSSLVRIVPALRDVSCEVPKGGVLGVVGRNGAGKSTLLRTIGGIVPPTEGRIVVRGRISAVLAAGVGFHRDLTGRDNIELGGLAMGIEEAQLSELAASIAAFAQLGEYVDLPVRSYSSGMVSRLAFSVAAHLEPEVLLIDEALAGGDSGFKEKCAAKMAELCGKGRTIVLVTHGLKAVRHMATSCLWLHRGHVVEFGDPDDVLPKYARFCKLNKDDEPWDD